MVTSSELRKITENVTTSTIFTLSPPPKCLNLEAV